MHTLPATNFSQANCKIEEVPEIPQLSAEFALYYEKHISSPSKISAFNLEHKMNFLFARLIGEWIQMKTHPGKDGFFNQFSDQTLWTAAQMAVPAPG